MSVRPIAFRASIAASSLTMVLGVSPALAIDFVVTDCSDDTELRQLVTAAQAIDGSRILFNCGTATIQVDAPIEVQTNQIIIDGGNSITLDGGNLSRLFIVAGAGSLALQYIVLDNGWSPEDGGAILVETSLLLFNARILHSEAGRFGGAIAAQSGSDVLIYEGSVLAHNHALSGGAIVVAHSGALASISDSELFDNHATDPLGGYGGAIVVAGTSGVDVVASNLYSNTANEGGAIYIGAMSGTGRVSRSRIADNTAAKGSGGGMVSRAGSLEVETTTFSGNKTQLRDGGGLFIEYTVGATIDNSTFTDNFGFDGGGGLVVKDSSQVYVTNSTFSGNAGDFGAGIVNFDSSTGLQNVTITGNDGGGLYNTTGSGHVLLVGNTIVANSTGQANCRDDGTETYISMGGNLSDDGSCVEFLNQSGDQHGADDGLGPLGMHGGLTATHVPQPGSDALDAAIDPGVGLTDQRGVDRPQGAAFDVGAIEVVACGPVTCGDANRNSSLTASDALAALRTAVGTASCPDWLCDYDGNGTIAASDALAILRASVGQSTNPSCPDAWDCFEDPT